MSQVVVHACHADGLPVVTGCPFRADAVPVGELRAVLTFSDGSTAAAQCVRTRPVSPGGVQWTELSFLTSTSGVADVSLQAADGAPEIARETDSGVELDNGLLRVVLTAASREAPLAVFRVQDGQAVSIGEIVPEMQIAGLGVCREAAGTTREVHILRNGSLRGQVELHGALVSESGKQTFAYRLTVELWAGHSAIRVDWMPAHLTPGVPAFEVERASLCGTWQVGKTTLRRFLQRSYSAAYVSREVENSALVALNADYECAPVHVADPAMLLDDSDYADYLTPPTVITDEWLTLQGDDATVFATLVDFGATRPNQLASDGNRLDYHMIPAGHTTKWPQGWRKEQTLLLAFVSGNVKGDTAAEARRQMKALNAVGRAQPTPATLIEQNCYDMPVVLGHVPGRNIRLSALLDRACRLNTPGEKWNLGDTPDWGYTRTYAVMANHHHPRPGAPKMPRHFAAANALVWPESDGDFLEPVWTNNEYDIIHALATELMRTGSSTHAAMLRWTARHNVEVDFISYSDDPKHHRASPFHSHFHRMKGAIPSHFFTQGLLEYHALTGDRDALEVALALGDKIVGILHSSEDVFRWKFDRELGWALLALVCLAEAGYDQYRAECDNAAEFLMAYDRAAFTGAVNLSAGREGRSLERQMIDNGFGYASMVEAMDRYQKLSGRDDTAEWLNELLYALKREMWAAIEEGEVLSIFHMATQMMAIGYERTGDDDFLRAGLLLLDNFFTQTALGMRANYGSFWGNVKPMAMLCRALHRLLGHADRADMLGRFEYPGILERNREDGT